jgi:hypothetical protein
MAAGGDRTRISGVPVYCHSYDSRRELLVVADSNDVPGERYLIRLVIMLFQN